MDLFSKEFHVYSSALHFLLRIARVGGSVRFCRQNRGNQLRTLDVDQLHGSRCLFVWASFLVGALVFNFFPSLFNTRCQKEGGRETGCGNILRRKKKISCALVVKVSL
jgi:hypothetical protein